MEYDGEQGKTNIKTTVHVEWEWLAAQQVVLAAETAHIYKHTRPQTALHVYTCVELYYRTAAPAAGVVHRRLDLCGKFS